MAVANSMSVSSDSPMRLERIMIRLDRWQRGGAREEHLLLRRGDVHVEALFGDGDDPSAARRVADRAVQADALGQQRVPLLPQLSNRPHLLHAGHSPPYDARGHQDETEQDGGDDRPRRGGGYATLRHA